MFRYQFTAYSSHRVDELPEVTTLNLSIIRLDCN